jgi:hypothetical protein
MLNKLKISIVAALAVMAEYAHAKLFNHMAHNGLILGANVLTDLAADLYKGADIVARELTGGASAVTINGNGSERVALNDVIRASFTRASTVGNVSPSMTIPEGTDQTVDNKTLTISKSRSVQIPWTGEDMKHVNNGIGFQTVYGDQVMQAMRALANEIEIDILTAAYQGASRAIGTAGTTPFASNFNTVAEIRQILVDNGMPIDNQASLVINTAAGTKLRNLAQLQKANESGNDQLLRQGVLLDLQGLMLKESAGVVNHTAGTGASYVTNGTFAVGDTAIAIDTGTGTILAGDVISFTGDTNAYVVASALSGGTVTIAEPGLRKALGDGVNVTVTAAAAKNVAFHRNAIELAIRPPAVPEGGDSATDAMTIVDPRSGLVFEVRAYKGYRKSMFEVSAAWGTKVWMPKYVAQLLG